MLTKSCEYAIRSVLFVAQNRTERKIGLRELAEALDIPVPFLGKIMQNLVRQQILSSTKGPNGGFFLRSSQMETALIRIVEIMDGLQVFQRCGLGLTMCSNERPCPVHDIVKPFRDKFEQWLRSQTVAQLAQSVANGNAFVMNGI